MARNSNKRRVTVHRLLMVGPKELAELRNEHELHEKRKVICWWFYVVTVICRYIVDVITVFPVTACSRCHEISGHRCLWPQRFLYPHLSDKPAV